MVIGLSGGVDSSVAAALLIEQGHEVIAMFMRNWNDESVTINNECPWIDDSNDALLAAQHLGIPYQVVDLSVEYKACIVDYMFGEYSAGRTPNPDVLCNREIKFDVFLKHALALGADYVATGHYCQKKTIEVDGVEHHQLVAGADKNKDQSYFLCQITEEQLSKIIFPIGHLQKSSVREIATKLNLPNAAKKDSQGLCFIGKVRLPDFLAQQIALREGEVIELPNHLPAFDQKRQSKELEEICSAYKFSPADGKVIGKHMGVHAYTIGQRRGLKIGGNEIPLFVVALDAKKNIVYVAKGEDHPALNRLGFMILKKDMHWMQNEDTMKDGEVRTYQMRMRYRQALETAHIHYLSGDYVYILFDQYSKGIAPGQFAVWYDGDVLVGSGVIS
ncbi:MAG: tRNA 2-thiouridine(34) synthase MnmA [Bacteroidetes bacterium]|nr:tRNA 2-thiouridine(34) synthase MnmA [Bacteroidota bacterium]